MILTILIPLWALAIAVILRDLDREQTARANAERNAALQHELDEATGQLVIWDTERRFRWAASRWRDYEAWRVRLREIEHARHIQALRLLWDGMCSHRGDPLEFCQKCRWWVA